MNNFNRMALKTVEVLIAAATSDRCAWIADRAYKLVEISYRWETAGTGTIDLKKCASGTAAASGNSVLSTAIDVSATASTVGYATLATNKDYLAFKRGDSLVMDVTSLASVAGGTISLVLEPM